VAYAGLVTAAALHTNAAPQSRLTDRPSIMGQSVSRVDIPAKVTGGAAYVHDLRLPGMVHARLVRPSGLGAQLTALDTAAVARMPGVIEVVRDGNFLAVVAQREFQAIQAMQALSAAAQWAPGPALPQAAVLQELTRLVVTSGTGTALAGVPGGPVGGKTGTAEFGSQVPPRTHSWFTGYQGDVAFAVLVEDGGFGAAVAAPLAAAFLRGLAG